MSLRLIAAADRRRMAWKNGGGETFEIAVHPAGAALAAFDWRVSMARVAADGPFSAFLGIDRTLCLLEGDGLDLAFAGGAPLTLSPASPPLRFAADVAATARLRGGPVLDLNVMTRRGVVDHTVERMALAAPHGVSLRPGTSFVVCGHGRIAERHSGLAMERYDTLQVDGPADLALAPIEAAATAFVVRIDARVA